MAKYNIHIDPKKPSKEEIASRKDFGHLLKDYEQVHRPWWVLRNFHKKRRLRKILILLFILAITLYFTSHYYKKDLKKHQEKQRQEQTTSYSAP